MDSGAINYDMYATVAGECIMPRVGCNIDSAANFDSLATRDATPTACRFVPRGCTDPTASNYHSLAQLDDGSCTPVVAGCRDPAASNYMPTATVQATCNYDILGCMQTAALNFQTLATRDDGSCTPNIPGCTLRGTSTFPAINFKRARVKLAFPPGRSACFSKNAKTLTKKSICFQKP